MANCNGGSKNVTKTYPGTVFKYDASTFYNWEQDNLPLDDLDNRTQFLYEQLGYPASSIDGVTFVLSSSENSDLNTYTDVSSIVAKLPHKLTFPVLIELCKYGDLGSLNLNGISCVGNGCIEVRNKIFAWDYSGINSPNTSSVPGFKLKASTHSLEHLTSVTSTAASALLAGNQSSKLGATTYNLASYNSNHRTFLLPHNELLEEWGRTSFGIGEFGNSHAGSANTFSVIPYYHEHEDTIPTDDADPCLFDGLGGTLDTGIYRWDNDTPLKASLLTFGNYFSNVSVQGCNGNHVKFFGVCVDSASGNNFSDKTHHLSDYGFDVINSNVILEHVASTRNKFAGFRFRNANVDVQRGIVAYRNYPLSGGSRATSEQDSILSQGVGVYAENSNISFPSNVTASANLGYDTHAFQKNGYGLYLKNSSLRGGLLHPGGEDNVDTTTTKLSINDNTQDGMKLNNSVVIFNGRIIANHNKVNGISAKNSEISTPTMTCIYNEKVGMLLENSEFTYGLHAADVSPDISNPKLQQEDAHSQVCLEGNSMNLVALKGSSVKPEDVAHKPERFGVFGGWDSGTRLMRAYSGDKVQDSYASGTRPMIYFDGGSYGEIVHLKAAPSIPTVPLKGAVAVAKGGSTLIFRGGETFPTRAVGYEELDNVNDLQKSWRVAGFCAMDNSIMEFTGPTKISRFGVDVLSENNSIVKFKPPTVKGSDFLLDGEGYTLSAAGGVNHSKIELHSTRACVVANKNSGIIFNNLGASAAHTADTGVTGGTLDSSSVSATGGSKRTMLETSGGYLQFYPNGFTRKAAAYASQVNGGSVGTGVSSADFPITGENGQGDATTGGMCVRAVNGSFVDANFVNFPMGVDASAVSGVYYNIEGTGGEHIHNYAGVGNALSGYGAADNYHGGSQIHIWNIADNSRIHAANFLVSSLNGSATNATNGVYYHGPAGRWASMCALDYYGADGHYGDVHYGVGGTGGNDDYHNDGPFRLMFGVNSDLMTVWEVTPSATVAASINFNELAKSHGTSVLGGSPAAQINAQGYAVPGVGASSLSGSDNFRFFGRVEHQATSESYDVGYPIFGAVPHARSSEGEGTWRTEMNGGRQFPPGMIDAANPTSGTEKTLFPNFPVPPINMDWQGYLRNYIDESAAATFANAKHAANKRLRLLSIYRSHVDPYLGGEGRDSTATDTVFTFGIGVRSINMFDLDRLV